MIEFLFIITFIVFIFVGIPALFKSFIHHNQIIILNNNFIIMHKNEIRTYISKDQIKDIIVKGSSIGVGSPGAVRASMGKDLSNASSQKLVLIINHGNKIDKEIENELNKFENTITIEVDILDKSFRNKFVKWLM
jgi:hypothetical protein